MSLFREIRRTAAEVARRARFVRIDADALDALACSWERDDAPSTLDPAHHHLGSAEETLAYIVTLDAINFGSGWFPVLRKRPGCSGYFTIATALKERFERVGPFSADELRALEPEHVAVLLGQDVGDAAVAELMAHFARALRDLGALLAERHAGRFGALVASAGESAERLVRELARMPYYRDVSQYGELEVPLYKRAQLTAADLAVAFDGRGAGRFEDLAQLTMFADNLVPHVLRREGALVYADSLAGTIDREEPIEPGSPQEVEIRAVGLHAVECLVGRLHERSRPDATPQRLDHWLWSRGGKPEMKAHPRHRARSVFY